MKNTHPVAQPTKSQYWIQIYPKKLIFFTSKIKKGPKITLELQRHVLAQDSDFTPHSPRLAVTPALSNQPMHPKMS